MKLSRFKIEGPNSSEDMGGRKYLQYVVKADSGEEVAQLTFEVRKDELQVQSLYVDPAYRSMGLATMLLNHATTKHRNQVMTMKAVNTDKLPFDLQAYYSRFGFKQMDDEGHMRREKT